MTVTMCQISLKINFVSYCLLLLMIEVDINEYLAENNTVKELKCSE